MSNGEEQGIPEICVGDFQLVGEPRGAGGIQRGQAQLFLAEHVEDIAQALPQDHLDQRVRHEVGDGPVRAFARDVGQGVWESLRRRPGHAASLADAYTMMPMDTHVNIIFSGIPNLSAQLTCAKLGGFAMIASATNGLSSWSSSSSSDSIPSPAW